jgi:outer membrane protein assembly factor BamB
MLLTMLPIHMPSLAPPIAVVPVFIGPLQTLLALLPAILLALGSLMFGLCRPSGFKKLVKFLWHQKVFTGLLVLIGVCIYTGIPLRYLHGQSKRPVELGADSATDWSAFRGGAQRHGAGPGQDDPTLAQPIWTFDRIRTVYSSPAVSGDRIYFSTVSDINPFTPTGRGAIVCLDAHSGRELWSYEPADFRGTFSSPVVSDGVLICGEGLHTVRDARVTCLDLSGQRLWELRTASHVESTACIDGGRAFIGAGDDGFYCIDTRPNADGAPHVVWHLDGRRYLDCESSPIVAGGVVYFGLGEGGRAICAVDAQSGDERWRIETPYPVFTSPTLADGKLYFGMGNGNFVQTAEEVMEMKLELMRQQGKSPAEIEAARATLGPAGEVWCIDVATAKVDWKFKLERTLLGAIAYREGKLYFGARDGFFYCVSSGGKLLGRWNAREPILSSPALGREHVYFTTSSGRLYCLRLDSLELVWDAALSYGDGSPSSPALAHGHVYIGTAESGLRCIGRPGAPKPPLWTNGEAGGAADSDLLPPEVAVAWQYPDAESDNAFRNSAPLMALGEFVYTAGERGGKPELIKLRCTGDPENTRHVEWTVPLAATVRVAPAGVGNRLFVVEEPVDERGRTMRCLNDEGGRSLWSAGLAGNATGNFAIDGRHLIVWGDNRADRNVATLTRRASEGTAVSVNSPSLARRVSVLSCLDAHMGNMIWKQTVAGDTSVGSPAVAQGIVLVTTNSSATALDELSGVVLWNVALPAAPLFGPVVSGNEFLLAGDVGLSLHRITDGGVEWQSPLGRIAAIPIVQSGHVVVVTGAGELVVLNVADGHVVHRVPCNHGSVPPLVDASRAIFWQENELVAIELESGELATWCFDDELGRMVTPLISAKGRGYFAREDGRVVCLWLDLP